MEKEFRIKFLKILSLIGAVTLFIMAFYNIKFKPIKYAVILGYLELIFFIVLVMSFFLIERFYNVVSITLAIIATIIITFAVRAEIISEKWDFGVWLPVYVLCISVLLGPSWGIISSIYLITATLFMFYTITNFANIWLKFYFVQIVLSLSFVSVFIFIFAVMWKRYEKILREKAEIDDLTGIYNRRKMLEFLEREIIRFERTNTPFCVIMLDLDNFKSINDSKGHLYGDKILRKVAETIKNSIRKIDYCGRYGGDEFLIIASGISMEGAQRLAERIKDRINSIGEDLTASIGIVEYKKDMSIKELISKVDEMLYKSKREGKIR